jgi:ubiquinone/menaquinone biosynthesis C-methylase UbiE
MTDKDLNPGYLLDSDEEPLRLERQSRIYGYDDDLRHLALAPTEQVLDAGCGSGAITRAIAKAVPNGQAMGVDREPKYVNFARHKAGLEGIENIRFEIGDVLDLPFEDDIFDIVWSKHLLQWVRDRERAIAEFKRVVRPGGRVVCCNFDGFCASHFPVDVELQDALDLWFEAAAKDLGFDNYIGRKLPSMFLEAGLSEVEVDFIPDRAFCGFGGDPEKRWNWDIQWQTAEPFSAKVFGSIDKAQHLRHRVVDHFSRPDVYVFCTLFYVEGRKLG